MGWKTRAGEQILVTPRAAIQSRAYKERAVGYSQREPACEACLGSLTPDAQLNMAGS